VVPPPEPPVVKQPVSEIEQLQLIQALCNYKS
jgi:hypothetical protein